MKYKVNEIKDQGFKYKPNPYTVAVMKEIQISPLEEQSYTIQAN